LVLGNAEGEGVGEDLDVPVTQIEAGVPRKIAEEVAGVVEVRDGVGLIADEIVLMPVSLSNNCLSQPVNLLNRFVAFV
jgi:hypothetical protein